MKRFRFFIIFSLIGGFCVLIDYSIYLFILRFTAHTFFPKIISSVVSVTVNYLLNSRFNFNNQRKENIKLYSQYLAVYTVLIILNATINSLLIHLTGQIKLSFWIAAVIAAFTNYFTVKVYFHKINSRK